MLTFASLEDDVRRTASLTCHVHITSPPLFVISAVLLEHSLCDGGVFVSFWENTTRRAWDICSAWQTPGPDFVTSSNVADVIIELNDAAFPCYITLSARAVKKPQEGQLELRHLSAKEGTAHLFGIFVSVPTSTVYVTS